MRDLRFALRTLAKSPGFTAVAVVSLALGIGANTAVFSLVNAILLESLPVANPQELRVLRWSGMDARTAWFTGSITPAGGRTISTGSAVYAGRLPNRTVADAFTFPQYLSLRAHGATEADIFAFTELRNVTVAMHHEPFVAEGLMVSDNFFPGLGVHPLWGRLFTAGDDRPGTPPIVVISYDWWANRYAFDRGVLGRSVSLNGHLFTIVGVLPREFHGVGLAERKEFYVPFSAQPQLMAGWPTTAPDRWWIHLMARMRPRGNSAQLQAALDVTFASLAGKYMQAPKIEISTGRAGLAYDQAYYRRPLLILLAVVVMVVLVACANLAGLSLARGAARQHEFAVRAALGSGRWRLIRQALTESLLLSLAGGGAGLLLAFWGKAAIARLLGGSPDGLHYDFALDLRVLGFTLALTFLTAVLAGLLPAWRAGQVDPLAGLKSRGALGAPRLQAGRILVAAQIALSVLLLTGAALYVRTLVNLVRINPGFDTENLLLFRLNPRAAGLHNTGEIAAFYDQVMDALVRIPGARDVALTQFPLLAGRMSGGSFFTLPAHPELTGARRPSAHRLTVSSAFFSTLGIPVLRGRGFTAADAAGAPKVVLVNQTFARKFFAGEDPIGQAIKTGHVAWTIVGVCGDARYTSIKLKAPPTVYFSYRQDPLGAADMAVRTSLPPTAIVAAARRAVADIDSRVPLADVTTEQAVRRQSISPEEMFATLVSALAGLAVLLACIGLYGLMAYNVTRRTGEIGVRLALGATPGRIARPVLREALVLAGTGVAVGVPVALALVQLIKSQLYGVVPFDPASLTAVVVLVAVVVLTAAWVPARKASRVDPMVALHTE